MKPKVSQVNYLSLLKRTTVIHRTLLHTKTNRAFHTWREAHCCFHPILNLEVQFKLPSCSSATIVKFSHLPTGDFARRNNFNDNPPIPYWCACSFSPKNSIRCFLAEIHTFLVHWNPASIVRWRATFSPFQKKNSRWLNNPTHDPTASGQTTRKRVVKGGSRSRKIKQSFHNSRNIK